MAADKQVSAASRRRTRLSGWVLSQLQVTLAICGIIVGFLVCFGLGFLSGVWFQTQEQMLPHDDAIALADDQLERERKALASGREMTFYSALTSRDGTLEPELKPRAIAAPVGESAPQPQAPKAVSSVVAPSPPSPAPRRREPDPRRREPDPRRREPDPRRRERVKPAEPERAEARRSAALSAIVSSRSSANAPQVSKPKRASAAVSASAAEALFYSVQVGSFRRVEQAYRLQDQLIKKGYQARIGLSIVEGKGAWYRVRVGRYADRGSADKTAQRLQKKENIDVLVMRVSS